MVTPEELAAFLGLLDFLRVALEMVLLLLGIFEMDLLLNIKPTINKFAGWNGVHKETILHQVAMIINLLFILRRKEENW